MAWERNFKNRVLKIRNRELKSQQLNYRIEVLWNAIWCVSRSRIGVKQGFISKYRSGSPILVTLISFWHFAVVREQILTPSIAFTTISGMHFFISQ